MKNGVNPLKSSFKDFILSPTFAPPFCGYDIYGLHGICSIRWACYTGESNPVIILRTGDRAASIGISESSGNSPLKAYVFQNHSGPPEKIDISGYAGYNLEEGDSGFKDMIVSVVITEARHVDRIIDFYYKATSDDDYKRYYDDTLKIINSTTVSDHTDVTQQPPTQPPSQPQQPDLPFI